MHAELDAIFRADADARTRVAEARARAADALSTLKQDLEQEHGAAVDRLKAATADEIARLERDAADRATLRAADAAARVHDRRTRADAARDAATRLFVDALFEDLPSVGGLSS